MIGILAVQGGFRAHGLRLAALGVPHRLVRLPEDLRDLDGLIIPGGESTTMLRLMHAFDLDQAVKDFARQGRPILGTCAGAILLSQTVVNPSQESLGLLPATIERNAYGCQRESFQVHLDLPSWSLSRIPAYFIRAPRFAELGDQVTPIASYDGHVVAVTCQALTAITFHPELHSDTHFHQAWVERMVLKKTKKS